MKDKRKEKREKKVVQADRPGMTGQVNPTPNSPHIWVEFGNCRTTRTYRDEMGGPVG